MSTIKKLFGLTLILIAFVVGFSSTNLVANPDECEDPDITYHYDDGWACEPAGNTCIVVWDCPGEGG